MNEGEDVMEAVGEALAGDAQPEPEVWQWNGPTSPSGKPMIELPRDGRSLSAFAEEVGRVLASNGVYVRDGIPVVIDPVTQRMAELDADCLRTYAEKTLLSAKFKRSRGEEEGSLVVSSMNREQAKGVLRSHQFLQHQRVVTEIRQVPIPVMRSSGKIELLEQGWDKQTGVLVLKGKGL
jgi:hypothetical protein